MHLHCSKTSPPFSPPPPPRHGWLLRGEAFPNAAAAAATTAGLRPAHARCVLTSRHPCLQRQRARLLQAVAVDDERRGASTRRKERRHDYRGARAILGESLFIGDERHRATVPEMTRRSPICRRPSFTTRRVPAARRHRRAAIARQRKASVCWPSTVRLPSPPRSATASPVALGDVEIGTAAAPQRPMKVNGRASPEKIGSAR